MRIIYIANARIPTERAHGIQIMKMCEAFALKGNEVELWVPFRFNKINKDPFDYYSVERVFKIKKIPSLDTIPLDFLIGRLAFWVQTLTFLSFARIYILFAKPHFLYTREPLCGLFFNNFILELHSPARGALYKLAKKIVVLTSFMKDYLVERGFSDKKIIVAPDGVDLNEFNLKLSKDDARKKLGLPLDGKIVMYVGSLSLYDWKGVDIFLESARIIQDEALFLVVGGSKKEIENLRADFNSDNIIFAGHQSRQKIPLYLKSADVLILPNKKDDDVSEKYTSPLKLFEYMASGVPIVASDLPSIREILNDGNTVFFEADNPESLAKKILDLSENSEFGIKISRQALEDVKKHSWLDRAKTLTEFFK